MQGEYLQDCLPLFVVLETVGTLEKTRMGQSGGFSFDLGWRRMLCRPASEHSSYAVEKVVADYQNKSYANVNTFGRNVDHLEPPDVESGELLVDQTEVDLAEKDRELYARSPDCQDHSLADASN